MVWGVDVGGGRGEDVGVWDGLLVTIFGRGGRRALRSCPGFMSPGKEYEQELAQDVGSCNIEVVFEGWYRDVSIELAIHYTAEIESRGELRGARRLLLGMLTRIRRATVGATLGIGRRW